MYSSNERKKPRARVRPPAAPAVDVTPEPAPLDPLAPQDFARTETLAAQDYTASQPPVTEDLVMGQPTGASGMPGATSAAHTHRWESGRCLDCNERQA